MKFFTQTKEGELSEGLTLPSSGGGGILVWSCGKRRWMSIATMEGPEIFREKDGRRTIRTADFGEFYPEKSYRQGEKVQSWEILFSAKHAPAYWSSLIIAVPVPPGETPPTAQVLRGSNPAWTPFPPRDGRPGPSDVEDLAGPAHALYSLNADNAFRVTWDDKRDWVVRLSLQQPPRVLSFADYEKEEERYWAEQGGPTPHPFSMT